MSTCSLAEVFREGNLTKVLELITKGFNINIKYVAGDTTYSEDPATGRYVEVRYMETPLTAWVANGRQSCVNLLLAAGTDVNFPDSLGLTPLMHAIVSDQPAIQTILLYNGANVNAMDHFYETALVKAVVRGKFCAAVPTTPTRCRAERCHMGQQNSPTPFHRDAAYCLNRSPCDTQS